MAITSWVMTILLSLVVTKITPQRQLQILDPKTVELRTQSLDFDKTKSGSLSCPAKGEKIRIACIGDSLTQRDQPDYPNYPPILQTFLGTEHFEVKNFGKGSQTACIHSNEPYAKHDRYRSAIEYRPHLVVIMLGTNDSKRKYWQGKQCGGSEAFLAGYRQILSGLVEQGIAPTVLVMQPPNIVKDNHHITSELLLEVRDSVKSMERTTTKAGGKTCGRYSLNEKEDLPSIVVAPEFPFIAEKNFQSDGIHFNEGGARQLACIILDNLLNYCDSAWGECFGNVPLWNESKQSCIQNNL